MSWFDLRTNLDVHKKIVEGVAHAPPKEGEKFLKDATNDGTITDHIKWVKTCVNEEESTHKHNIVNNEEFVRTQSSEKSTATCCTVCSTCCKKIIMMSWTKDQKKLRNFVCLGFQ